MFPPGYAAILSLGVLLKIPQLVGPGIAACLVVATAALAGRVFHDHRILVVAALLSTLCATLRYHTADTLSHGLAALLFTVSLWGAVGASRRDVIVSGICAGWLIATRPVTALALCLVIALILRRVSLKWWIIFGTALLPGITAWLVYQRITTGSYLNSTQLAYYAISDGPPGCFRYGFGRGIGCQFEHGRYVAKRLPNGYTPLAALVVSGVRLRWHLLDILNFEPLALILLLATRGVQRGHVARRLISGAGNTTDRLCPISFRWQFSGRGSPFARRRYSDRTYINFELARPGVPFYSGYCPVALRLWPARRVWASPIAESRRWPSDVRAQCAKESGGFTRADSG